MNSHSATTGRAATTHFRSTHPSLAFLLLAMASSSASACFDCRAAVEAQVYGSGFAVNLLALFLPLLILAMVGLLALYSDAIVQRFSSKGRHYEQ